MIGEKQRIGNLAGDMKLNELIIQRHIYIALKDIIRIWNKEQIWKLLFI